MSYTVNETIASSNRSADGEKRRFSITDCTPVIFADVYLEEVNMAIWQRELNRELKDAADAFSASHPRFECGLIVSPDNALDTLKKEIPKLPAALAEDVTDLVDMFCSLFELTSTGMRLAVLDKAMCPRFHVDHVPCRLVTTYKGIATQWLPHTVVDRSRLGPGSNGQADHTSGLYKAAGDVQQLTSGDVALLKGEGWPSNENAGLVHRSPTVESGASRLFFTLDFST
ncbi:MAG: DUF1826 domain-containing protein [bacterium]